MKVYRIHQTTLICFCHNFQFYCCFLPFLWDVFISALSLPHRHSPRSHRWEMKSLPRDNASITDHQLANITVSTWMSFSSHAVGGSFHTRQRLRQQRRVSKPVWNIRGFWLLFFVLQVRLWWCSGTTSTYRTTTIWGASPSRQHCTTPAGLFLRIKRSANESNTGFFNLPEAVFLFYLWITKTLTLTLPLYSFMHVHLWLHVLIKGGSRVLDFAFVYKYQQKLARAMFVFRFLDLLCMQETSKITDIYIIVD